MKAEMGHLPVIPVFLNERGPYRLAVDTGYLGLNISPHVAHDLGLKKDENDSVILEAFAVEDLLFRNFDIDVRGNKAISKMIGKDIDGLMGMGLLKYFEVTIDYPASTVFLLPLSSLIGARRRPEPGFSYVRVKYPNGYVAVPAYIDESGPYDFLLDTGANRCIVSEEIADRLGLPKGDVEVAHGAVDERKSYGSRVKVLRIGEKAAKNLQVSVMDCTQTSKYADCRIDGYIGYNFLKGFCMVINVLDLYLGLR